MDIDFYMQETKPKPATELDITNNTNSELDYNDDEIAVENDLFFKAICKQMERQKDYMLHSTSAMFNEIDEHERYITTAMCDLNVHFHRTISTFKATNRIPRKHALIS